MVNENDFGIYALKGHSGPFNYFHSVGSITPVYEQEVKKASENLNQEKEKRSGFDVTGAQSRR